MNAATKKDHFPLPFINQILNQLVGQSYFCFFDGYLGYNQITIDPNDQEKTTYTYPFGTFTFRQMSFGLYNPLATFQRCMMAIFSDFLSDSLEVFMENFLIFLDDFNSHLAHLTKILEVYIRKRLVLSWEKLYFMMREGVVLGHLVSGKGFEVDKTKIEVIQNLPLPATLRDLQSFLGHVGFYRRFIRDFAEVSKLLSTLLCKDKDFFIDKEGENTFEILKLAFIKAPILQYPNWNLPFEIMCDASNYVVGVVLGQRMDKKPTTIWYASKTLAKAQMNYATMENELLAMVYALENFWPYILVSKIVIYIDHSALEYLFSKNKANPGKERLLQLQKLQELRHNAYENVAIYKEKTKAFHDRNIRRRSFQVNEKVWLYNWRLKLFPRKLHSRWDGPYVVLELFDGGAVLISDIQSGREFKVNSHSLKPYLTLDALELVDKVNLHLLEHSRT